MELPQRKSNRIRGHNYSRNGSYFITICTLDRRKILSKISVGTPVPGCPQIDLSRYGIVADKYIRQMAAYYDHLSVDNYVIMPDHIHMLITVYTPDGHPGRGVPTQENGRTSAIARFVGTFKRFCNKEYGDNIWQGRYYDHVIRNQHDYDEVWQYIENNPVKWLVENRMLD